MNKWMSVRGAVVVAAVAGLVLAGVAMRQAQAGWVMDGVPAGATGTRESGFSMRQAMDASGVADVLHGAENRVWRPTAVAVQLTAGTLRTVQISRVVDGTPYVLASFSGDAATYVYEFEGTYWFKGTEPLRVSVTPAEAGTVEIMGE